MTKLRQWWQDINASYWFLPALFSVLALFLALGTIYLDRIGWSERLTDLPQIIPARPEGASNMLTVIAGSMIGTAATVFSITIAAVAYASGNYGPRLLTNFMEDRGNQFSLAIFISTFVYAITVLRSVRAEDEAAASIEDAVATSLPGFVPQLSLLVAYALMGLSVAVLVFFLNHIPASIRINTVLKDIGARLIAKVKDRFPDKDSGIEPENRPEGIPIRAHGTGYIQIIDYDALDQIAGDRDCHIVMAVRTGDFVHNEMIIAYWADESDEDAEEECPDGEVRDCFALGSRRTPGQDLQFLIDELVEIGLRALSPGINDPFTAITALHWLGAATAELGGRDLRIRVNGHDDPHEDRVVTLDDDFSHYVRRGFGSIRSGVATNRIAALAMFDALLNARGSLKNESREKILRDEGELLVRQAREHLLGPELETVEARYARFDHAFS
ncbi:DUF2254 domain-containing protein [Pseudoblastomonas halimionae]|uniref:DUF2254 domain-containing protein n=1 Tax=Alteriqipengyuania halimionae TaxID=1926630 RepID=A0A6I4U560_9SPHN|nr:DUF2254 domain-containing protein [Alteriqipengyuania halimionae]MXP10494.1 DUF2254 domain-containing protein [Alteriqipengyuania halimionae]